MSSLAMAQIPTIAEIKDMGLVHEVSSFHHNASGTFGDENTFLLPFVNSNNDTMFLVGFYLCEYDLKAGDIITAAFKAHRGELGIFQVFNQQEVEQTTTTISSTIRAFKAETDGIYYIRCTEPFDIGTYGYDYYDFSYTANILRYGKIQSISFQGELPSSTETSKFNVLSALGNLSVKGTDTYGEEINLFSGGLSQWTIDMENKIAHFNPVAVTLMQPFLSNFPLTLGGGVENYVSWGQATPTTYTVSGTVTSSSTALENVNMSCAGCLTSSTQTNANGEYSFTVTENANVIITPSLQGYEFTPTDTTINNVVQNVVNVNFTADVLSANSVISAENLTIFPNPANNILYFSSETAFEVTDMQGRILLKSDIAVKSLNVSNLGAGIYFIKTGNSVQKFVKN